MEKNHCIRKKQNIFPLLFIIRNYFTLENIIIVW